MYHQTTLCFRSITASLLACLILFSTSSCHYFKVKTERQLPSIEDISAIGKDFVVHHRYKSYYLKEIQADSTKVGGLLIYALQPYHYSKLRSKRYAKRSEKSIIHEVHLYLKDDIELQEGEQVEIPFDAVEELHIVDLDTGTTVASYVFSAVGITAIALTLVAIILLLTKSSCPYIYSHNGEAFLFEGESFGGAIMQNMERADMIPLPNLQSDQGQYRVLISNELKERQYTNYAHLLTVNHPIGTKVLIDPFGQAQLIQHTEAPIHALNTTGIDIQPTLAETDQEVYFFDDLSSDLNTLDVQFENPHAIDTAKLVFRAKNTLWMDYMVGEFTKLFGSYFDTWMEQQAQISTERRQKRYEADQFPLSIFVHTTTGWKLVEKIATVGPLAYRDFVVPIDLHEIEGEHLQIRFETGFLNWEVDQVALETSAHTTTLEIERNLPFNVSGTKDGISKLATDDDQYLAQPNVGDATELRFFAPEIPEGQIQTAFLDTKGYYELIRDYQGLPKLSALKPFKQAGYFMTFSRQRYHQYMGIQNNFVVQ